MSDRKTVFVIDDDPAVRDSLELLVGSIGLPVETFSSGDQFLAAYRPDMSGCLVLDVRMPGMSGIEVQKTLSQEGATLPVIFITGHGDVPMAVEAVKGGALDFIEKPFNDQQLLDRIQRALDLESEARRQARIDQEIQHRIESLTRREREVMKLLVEGATNKVIAHRLELSPRTVEIHRASVMHKMRADSVAGLVRMVLSSSEESPPA